MRRCVAGVLVGRGVLRNPWILAQAADLASDRPPREVTLADRGQFLLEYIDLLLGERVRDDREGSLRERSHDRSVSHDRWVVNKIRALGSWYTKGLDSGSHLRIAINSAESIAALREIVRSFFAVPVLSSQL